MTSLRYTPAQPQCTPSWLLRIWRQALALRPACKAKPGLDGGSLPANNARTGLQGLSTVIRNNIWQKSDTMHGLPTGSTRRPRPTGAKKPRQQCTNLATGTNIDVCKHMRTCESMLQALVWPEETKLPRQVLCCHQEQTLLNQLRSSDKLDAKRNEQHTSPLLKVGWLKRNSVLCARYRLGNTTILRKHLLKLVDKAAQRGGQPSIASKPCLL